MVVIDSFDAEADVAGAGAPDFGEAAPRKRPVDRGELARRGAVIALPVRGGRPTLCGIGALQRLEQPPGLDVVPLPQQNLRETELRFARLRVGSKSLTVKLFSGCKVFLRCQPLGLLDQLCEPQDGAPSEPHRGKRKRITAIIDHRFSDSQ